MGFFCWLFTNCLWVLELRVLAICVLALLEILCCFADTLVVLELKYVAFDAGFLRVFVLGPLCVLIFADYLYLVGCLGLAVVLMLFVVLFSTLIVGFYCCLVW